MSLINISINTALTRPTVSFGRQSFQQLSTSVKGREKFQNESLVKGEGENRHCVIVFDILYYNNNSCLDLPLNERRRLLEQICIEHPSTFELAKGIRIYVPENGVEEDTDSSLFDVVDTTLKEAVSAGCEGLMIKMFTAKNAAPIQKKKQQIQQIIETIEEDDFGFPVTKRTVVIVEAEEDVKEMLITDSKITSIDKSIKKKKKVAMEMLVSKYKVGKRSDAWRKLKIDYIDGEGIADSIDVVPIGGWRGKGRKSKWYSPILCAVYNPMDDTYESLCRVMSGFTDKEYERIFNSLQVVEDKPRNVITNEKPSFWFKQKEVWEIQGADISESPVHCAGIGQGGDGRNESRGLSLRFPRFRMLRVDKGLKNATTNLQVVEMFFQQRT